MSDLELLLKGLPTGPMLRAHTNNVFGLNHQKAKTPLQHIKQKWGYTFFTRPQLNLQSDNIRGVRRLHNLLSEDIYSPQRIVRCLLDPRLKIGYGTKPKYNAPLVDNKTAFIPILTNNLNTITGWPDELVPIYTSTPGNFKEEYSMVDGSNQIFNNFDLTTTYENVAGNIIKMLLNTWSTYMSAVFSGEMSPYPDFIVENEIDYNTRIYRIVLDDTGRFVSEIAATGSTLLPVNPVGGSFDYNRTEGVYNNTIKELNIRWQATGAIYNDPILIHTFNETVGIFNPMMRDNRRDDTMAKITKDLVYYFNHRGYPRINPKNNEMEWWVEKELIEPKEVPPYL